MKITSLRLRYTQLFIISLLGFSFYTASQSLPDGIGKFEENIWNKQLLINNFTTLKLILGDRVFPQALVGKEGWLEYTGDLTNYKNKNISPAKIKKLQEKIQKLYDKLRKKNITLILIIPPSKATIYPDKLPDEIKKTIKQSNLELLSASLQGQGPPVLVDLTSPLINERKKHDVYYKTDTHWNLYGAFTAYTEVMNALTKTYPQLAPKSMDNFTIKTGQPKVRDIPRMMGTTYLLESGMDATINQDPPSPISGASNKDSLSLLMFMDSFGIRMKDFISPHFKKAIFLSNKKAQTKKLALKTIDSMKPNIIIVEFVERSFNARQLEIFLNQLLADQNQP